MNGSSSPAMSSDFEWDTARKERSHEALEKYDVQKAKELIDARQGQLRKSI